MVQLHRPCQHYACLSNIKLCCRILSCTSIHIIMGYLSHISVFTLILPSVHKVQSTTTVKVACFGNKSSRFIKKMIVFVFLQIEQLSKYHSHWYWFIIVRPMHGNRVKKVGVLSRQIILCTSTPVSTKKKRNRVQNIELQRERKWRFKKCKNYDEVNGKNGNSSLSYQRSVQGPNNRGRSCS